MLTESHHVLVRCDHPDHTPGKFPETTAVNEVNSNMKIGTKVKMVNCVEAETYEGRIWMTRSEPWPLGDGTEVVLLEGKSGGFATRCLEIVEDPSIGLYYSGDAKIHASKVH